VSFTAPPPIALRPFLGRFVTTGAGNQPEPGPEGGNTLNLKRKIATFALAATIGGALMTTPAFGAASPNENGTNCHGVWLSYQSTSDMAPGQLHKDFGTSMKDVQAVADIVCS
jgi:hypothetical protein